MKEEEQKNVINNNAISPLAKDETYGEKVYDAIFKTGINFWVNLTASAVFSYWVAHSRNPVKLPFVKEAKPLQEVQADIGRWIEKRWFMKGIKDDATRLERAHSMASTLTLMTPGHFIMIPGVWFGAKIKTPLVEWLDRKHYGDDADLDTSIQMRHRIIETEQKPTLLGAVVGRLGAFLAGQITARLVGTPNNWLNHVGEKTNISAFKKFQGMDPVAETIGEEMGGIVERQMPRFNERVNNYFSGRNYSWSQKQTRDPAMDTNAPYNRVLKDLGRYLGADVLYSAITALTVHPILHVLRDIPGITYRARAKTPPVVAEDKPEKLPAILGEEKVAAAPATKHEQKEEAEEAPQHEKPHHQVHHVQHHAHIAHSTHEVQA